MRRYLAVSAVALVAGSVAVYVAYPKDKAGAAAGLKTVAVVREDVARVVLATGKIEPLTKVELKSRASGVVEKLLVDVADGVESGQVVAELDKSILEARVRQSRASCDAARAELEKAQIESEPTEFEFAQKDVQRTKELFGKELISGADMDNSEKDFRM